MGLSQTGKKTEWLTVGIQHEGDTDTAVLCYHSEMYLEFKYNTWICNYVKH